MTPEEEQANMEMRALVESVGECWHVFTNGYLSKCEKCGVSSCRGFINPSPTDLNELFRRAKKLELIMEIDIGEDGATELSVHRDRRSRRPAGQSLHGLPLADALRKALFQAVKEVA